MLYKFVETTWYFPDDGYAYEEVTSTKSDLTIVEALDLLKKWFEQNPDGYIEDANYYAVEATNDVSEGIQLTARIEYDEDNNIEIGNDDE